MGQGSSDLRYASEGPPPAGWRRQVCERTSFPRAATCWRVHVECAVVISVIPVPHRVGKGLTELSPALKHRCFDLFGSYGSTGVWVMPPGLRTLRIAARVCPFSMAAAEGQGRCLGVEESLGARGPRADG